ncbi:pyridoxamine 5'-phosphate oxidase family protein [Azospirillum sp. TSO22-1]|uniref:pyridoxamine 5'-phosphate oxidase family protein n=1 Tax=Azospirillum sp. TSO22-1 TaxID=716789 RepID=UPI000D611FA6|nr:pyridoxamine 5'-phosphate oxidase family protein [Azospirillum sp. TSO22-1]PWC45843.1 hypothetical protein TSO221_15780 [Azospirillum sp. TSO22-1]
MPVSLSAEVADLIADPTAAKVLVTTDEDGTPHAVATDFLEIAGDGTILYLEPLESSASNRNLVRSIWYDRRVAIALKGADGRSVQIKGRPVRTHVAGPVFQRHYVDFQERHGDIDLAAVWVIRPEAVHDEDFGRAKAHEEATRPFFRHLDRIAKQPEAAR